MNEETTKNVKPFYKKWWFIAIVVVIVLRVIGGGQESTGTQTVAESPAVQLPQDQLKFIEIVKNAQDKVVSAGNDMVKGGIRMEREKALCGLVNGSIKDWVGTLIEIDANSDGKGVLSIEIEKNITVKTWNNDISDSDTQTMLAPGSPIFQKVSQMKVGQQVKFSGDFFQGSDGECLLEGSLSLDGKITDPEFIFRFSAVDII